jgi:glucose-1-phosphate thymidylyltransferase
MADTDPKIRREVVGLLPAAGQATRLAPMPCSKEIYPVGYRLVNGEGERRPKVACHYLLEKMHAAGISKAYIVIREGKWDIPAYLRGGGMLKMDLAYLTADLPFGPPYTLDQAYAFVRNAIVAFGFPDILFAGDYAFKQLLSYQAKNEPDILLGLFPGDQPQKMDMVDLDEDGRVRAIVIKPRHTELRYSWNIALWTPAFTEFLHSHVADSSTAAWPQSELSVGHVIQAAICAGLRVQGFPVSDEPYLDIGTPEGLARAIKRFGADALEETGE